ncbi:MAG: DUF3857 domain-containing protein [Verrucomicrobiota bacterium]
MPRRLTTVLFFLFTGILAAAPAGLEREPTPDWARINPPGAPAPADTVTGGVNYLLADQQWRLGPEIAAYARYAYLVTHSSGLQEAAELSFTYAPEYERIGFHKVEVIRDDRVVDQLDLERFELLREERDREHGLYDGRLTAVLHLRDVRVGDIVDYAYTTHGQNPIFGGTFMRTFSTGWSVPLGRQFARVTVPPGRDLFVREHGPASPLAFSETTGADGRVLTWQAEAPVPLQADKATPDWYLDFPYVQLSEFAAWSQVVDWALPLYPLDTPPAPALQAEVDRIRAGSEDAETRLLDALKLVQEDVRYLGYELGEGSHRPRPAAETWEKRFGDCKDKTLLFCTLARALGWDARPALVHSYRGQRLPLMQPTAHAFNHVIATVRHPDGRRLWFDPTSTLLAGDLEQHASPDYHHALIVAPGETTLADMAMPYAARGRTRVEVVYTSHGYDQPGELRVVTTHLGENAGDMRDRLLRNTTADLSRDYLEYYANDYPGITVLTPLAAEDDTTANIVTLTEHYSIPKLWVASDDDAAALELALSTTLIGDYIRKPANGARTTPLAVSHPRDVTERVVVDLHTDWEIDPFSHRVDNPGFLYEKAGRMENEGRRLVLDYVYRSKQDHVPADAVDGFLRDVDSINVSIGYLLTYTPPADGDTGDETDAGGAAPASAGTGVNLRTIGVMALVAIAGVIVWVRLARRARPQEPPPLPESANDPVGLGGWLVLPMIGLVLRPVMLVVIMTQNAAGYFDEATWQALVDPASAGYSPGLAALILFEAAGNTTSFMMTLITGWLFFTRRRETPSWMIALLLFSAGLLLVDTVALHAVQDTMFSNEDSFEILKTFITATIWTGYFLRSRRVKRTFTR